MAHSPKVKAAAVADLLTGLSCEKVAKRHGVGKATVVAWLNELKTDQNRPDEATKPDRSENKVAITVEARQRSFDDHLNKLLFSALDMLQSWAELSADKGFARENPTGAKDLGSAVLDRLDRIADRIVAMDPEESRSAGTEV